MPMKISDFSIGQASRPYVIAELSGNHNGSLERALEIVESAAATGVQAIKLQTYRADTLTLDVQAGEFVITDPKSIWKGRSLHSLYEEAHTPWEWHEPIMTRAAQLGLTCFSSPFDETAVDLLSGLDAPAYKIASFEAVDLPLIRYAAARGRPLIISTGMANEAEIAAARDAALAGGAGGVILLHCVSSYPASFADANLRTVPDMAARFGCPVGLSDHTPGTAASVAAVALGACVIEKHFTLARADGGPDAAFSLEPAEFAALVRDCRDAWASLGRAHYDLLGSEAGNIQFRRSLYIVADVAEGELLTRDHVRSVRPGNGLAPDAINAVLGRPAARALRRGEPLGLEMLASPNSGIPVR